MCRITSDYEDAGMATMLTGAVNGLIYAERHGCVPWIDWTAAVDVQPVVGRAQFQVRGRDPNVWLNFFEPVSAAYRPDVPTTTRVTLVRPYYTGVPPNTPKGALKLNRSLSLHHRAGFVQSYYYGISAWERNFRATRFERRWYEENRMRAGRVVARYFRVRPNVMLPVKEFLANNNPDSAPLLGVQIRASDITPSFIDRRVTRKIGLMPFVPYMLAWLAHQPNGKIFVASDVPALEDFARRSSHPAGHSRLRMPSNRPTHCSPHGTTPDD